MVDLKMMFFFKSLASLFPGGRIFKVKHAGLQG